jgi:hypothetical protein
MLSVEESHDGRRAFRWPVPSRFGWRDPLKQVMARFVPHSPEMAGMRFYWGFWLWSRYLREGKVESPVRLKVFIFQSDWP